MSSVVITSKPMDKFPLRRRPRGLMAQLRQSLTHPQAFFRELPLNGQWLWIVVALFALTSLYTLQQDNQAETQPTDFVADPILQDPSFVSPVVIDAGMSTGEMPPPDIGFIPPNEEPIGTQPNVTRQIVTVLIANVHWMVACLGLAVILSEVSLLKGRAPNLSMNLNIAVWTMAPFLINGVLRLGFLSIGGEPPPAGLSASLSSWEFYNTSAPFVQMLLTQAAGQITLFSLWSLLLVYWGARYTLGGSRVSSLFVVSLWVAIVIIVPAGLRFVYGS